MNEAAFDYIIVGAGSAGCVLANKLSENPRHKVLLIEAGGSDARFWIKVPLGYAKTFADRAVNWSYSTQPDPGLNGRKAYWPRGRVIGGSSSINAMAYLRGLPHDFDDWERAGATGWNWEVVRKTYEALECQVEGAIEKGSGPLVVSDVSAGMHPFVRNFLDAAREMGWTVARNLNGEDAEGLMRMRSTVRKGRRWSAADAFLRPAMKRSNLRVISRAFVEKLIVENKRAAGVQFRSGGVQHIVGANKEVILSAGAINSPQILQLSGIGPAALLEAHGITVLHELPEVGQGLQDHLAVSQYYRATEPTLNNTLGAGLGRMLAGLRYILTRKGPLSVPVNQISGYVRSSPESEVPDVQVYCNPMSYITHTSGAVAVDPAPGFLLCVQPSRPTSRGQVTIASANPADQPLIQPNSLATTRDCETVIKASRLLKQLAQTKAIRAVTKVPLQPDISTMDDAALLENFRSRAGTVFHPSCTCRMGHDASDSVLDARLRVHGMKGLRVVDASAFPNITSGNTNGPTIMLAARAAELILQDA
ncbi:choline dehydrogenase [Sinorhizobium sp. A49]|uniref:GMC family oxidoreductase n=1 Tax=Sinorhizobium sp. A49 TaxID=1945861 RepID=UPI000985BD47|nr:GMC family oxidoreductase N-terminal domain-containing protein [Sinorhizobium sp. A49]OOG62316.1 choline dehydrogenase [Sinorhizobium sp. A49]